MDEEMEKKIAALEEKGRKARKEALDTVDPIAGRTSIDEHEDDSPGATAGAEFLALVISGGILGFGIDHFFHTTPWGIIFMLLMGFVAGVYRANDTAKKNQ